MICKYKHNLHSYLQQLVDTLVLDSEGGGQCTVTHNDNPEGHHNLPLPTAGPEHLLVDISCNQRTGGEEGAIGAAHDCSRNGSQAKPGNRRWGEVLQSEGHY